MTVIAIVPARGGSKGVPKKNLEKVGGVPLIARSINACKNSKSIDRIIVSTDDLEISRVALEHGAEVVVRPSDLAGDSASSESAIEHCINELNIDADAVIVFVQCTSPFTQSDDLDAAVELVRSKKYDSVFSAVPSHGFLWKLSESGLAQGINHDPKLARVRRQDKTAEYKETGAFYVFNCGPFLNSLNRFVGATMWIEVDESQNIDIDSSFDLQKARVFASSQRNESLVDVKGIIFDFDGVHTNNFVYVDEQGTESIRASRLDGMGIEMLKKKGIPMCVLSKEKNRVVAARCEKLGLPFIQGLDEKSEAVRTWANSNDLSLEQIAYVGNDLNDLSSMSIVGWPIAVSDAVVQVKLSARLILNAAGGSGAIRELAELMLQKKNDVRDIDGKS